MSVSSNHFAGPAVPLWLSSHKVLTWEKVSVYLKTANHAEVLKKLKIYCRHVQLGMNLAGSHWCHWRRKDFFVSGCGFLHIFWYDVLISLFHSRKPYVNLLKNIVKIIVVSWRESSWVLAAGKTMPVGWWGGKRRWRFCPGTAVVTQRAGRAEPVLVFSLTADESWLQSGSRAPPDLWRVQVWAQSLCMLSEEP